MLGLAAGGKDGDGEAIPPPQENPDMIVVLTMEIGPIDPKGQA